MNSDTLRSLEQWIEDQAEFGGIPLPDGMDRGALLDARRLRQAWEHAGGAAQLPSLAAKAPAHSPATPPRPMPAAPQDAAGSKLSLRSVPSAKPSAQSATPPASKTPPAQAFQQKWADLDELRGAVAACQGCPLAQRRTQTVFGVGSPTADLVIVGEAPGEQEDLQGEPFVGPAGQLLDKMLAAIGFARADVFICNTLKCRPPFNRDPAGPELAACRGFLDHQLHFLKPKLLLAAGRIAGQALLGREATLASMRGQEFSFNGIPLRVTYHPAALLRNEHWKRPAWEDLQALRRRYDELGGRPGSLPGAPAKG